ncbi:uncharacterized protein LOC143346597 [Colletes latitarsis]|uniref:uncharacterized protein LOC143346597 n=1 Tax=Colletes latitarsis TaxID=2605962 RepID=UPI004034FF42
MNNSTTLGLLVILHGLCCAPCICASPVDASGAEVQSLLNVSRDKMADEFVATLNTNLTNIVEFLTSRTDRFLQRLVETVTRFVKCLFSIVDSALRWIVSSIASILDWFLGSANSRRSRSWMTNTSLSMDYLQTLINPLKDYILQEVEVIREEVVRRLLDYLVSRLP